ncbi:MAG: LiaI-LiaF-like domain-containing protein [Candidatus Acidiferrales bacterium]
MKCANHAEAEATGFCRNCGKAMCDQCKREVTGALYCEQCLAAHVSSGPQAAHSPNPGLAFGLGFVPGLGAVYNGDYTRALVHLGIWIGLFALGTSDAAGNFTPLVWIIFGLFPMYMAIDSMRYAQALRAGQRPTGFGVPSPPASPTIAMPPQGAPSGVPAAGFVPTGETPATANVPGEANPAGQTAVPRRPTGPVAAIILIGLGVLFLMGNLDIFPTRIFEHGWPLILVVIGIWMLYRRRPTGG